MRFTNQKTIAYGTMLLALLVCISRPAMAADPEDVVAKARQLAYSGKEHRSEALSLLKQHLQQDPDDSEARVLYGTVLSWEGQYDDARTQLKQVLAKRPNHGDALPALLNVEFWSDHPAAAEAIAREALSRQPDTIYLLLADAKALIRLNRSRDALPVLDRALILDATNRQAREMRREVTLNNPRREVLITHSYDWFSDGRNGQLETTLSFKNPTPYGSLVANLNRADRFSTVDYQTELEFYPHIRPGTYGYLNVGYSVHGSLYPSYKFGGDLYQSVGHGFELSGGYRRLAFTSGVDIYTFSIAKYFHDFLFTMRGFVVPGDPGTSGTALFSARYFLGSEGMHNYLEFRYSHGASPAQAQTLQDIQVLNSSKYTFVFDKSLGGRFNAAFTGSLAQAQRVNGLQDLQQYEVSGALLYRF